jgi:branched-chain amino acid transport system substrate-binding protein
VSYLRLLTLAALTACTGGGADAPKEIVIGEYGSLTGTAATFGISTKEGIELATNEQNSKGGIGGVQIRVVVEDDQSKPEEAATAVSKILSSDHPVAVLGEVSSSRSLAAAPLLQRAGVPMVTPSSTNEKVTQVGDFIFRVCFIDPFQGEAIAKFAYNDKAIRKAAILRDVKNDYSVGLANVFTRSFTGMGGEIVGDEAYSEGDFDFKAQLSSLIAKSPDAMILTGYYTEVARIAVQARELGYAGIFLGGDGWDSETLVANGKEAILGAYYTNHYSVDDPDPAVQAFISKYEAVYHKKPDGLAALGYDAAKILYLSMEDVAKDPAMAAAFADRSTVPATEGTRKAAREALRDRLARVENYPGVTGTITIDKDRNATKPAVVVEVTKDGPKFVSKIVPGGAAPEAPAPAEPAAPSEAAAGEGAAPAPEAPAAPAPQ